MIELSIVIPTYNRRELLLRTLSSLESQTLAPSKFEVVVVVDGSSDGTLEALSNLKTQFRLETLSQDNRGQAAARNLGAERASSELLLFLDDDIICSEGLLVEHLSLAKAQSNCVVFGPVFLAETSQLSVPAEAYREYAERRFSRINQIGPALPQDAMLAPNSSIATERFRSAGGYDTSLERLEDIELGYRLWKLGTAFIYDNAAMAFHSYDKDADKLVSADASRFGVSDLKLCRMHPEYRISSAIRRFVERRSFLARVVVSLPFSPDPILAVLYRVATSLSTRSAIRLLQMRQGIVALRSAVAYAGGWAALKSQVSGRDSRA